MTIDGSTSPVASFNGMIAVDLERRLLQLGHAQDRASIAMGVYFFARMRYCLFGIDVSIEVPNPWGFGIDGLCHQEITANLGCTRFEAPFFKASFEGGVLIVQRPNLTKPWANLVTAMQAFIKEEFLTVNYSGDPTHDITINLQSLIVVPPPQETVELTSEQP